MRNQLRKGDVAQVLFGSEGREDVQVEYVNKHLHQRVTLEGAPSTLIVVDRGRVQIVLVSLQKPSHHDALSHDAFHAFPVPLQVFVVVQLLGKHFAQTLCLRRV